MAYDELRRYSHRLMGLQADSLTLGPTGLVHEAYLGITKDGDWFRKLNPDSGEQHFRALMARTMRNILVSYIRQKKTTKRAGNLRRLDFEHVVNFIEDESFSLVELSDLVDRLYSVSKPAAEVFDMRVFGGFSIPDVRDKLQLSEREQRNYWEFAKTFLAAELS